MSSKTGQISLALILSARFSRCIKSVSSKRKKTGKNLDKFFFIFVCPPLVPPPPFYSDVCGDSYSVCIYIYGYSSLFFSLPTSFLTGSGSLSVVLSARPLTCTICTGSPSARYRYTSNPMPVQCKPCQCPYHTLVCL